MSAPAGAGPHERARPRSRAAPPRSHCPGGSRGSARQPVAGESPGAWCPLGFAALHSRRSWLPTGRPLLRNRAAFSPCAPHTARHRRLGASRPLPRERRALASSPGQPGAPPGPALTGRDRRSPPLVRCPVMTTTFEDLAAAGVCHPKVLRPGPADEELAPHVPTRSRLRKQIFLTRSRPDRARTASAAKEILYRAQRRALCPADRRVGPTDQVHIGWTGTTTHRRQTPWPHRTSTVVVHHREPHARPGAAVHSRAGRRCARCGSPSTPAARTAPRASGRTRPTTSTSPCGARRARTPRGSSARAGRSASRAASSGASGKPLRAPQAPGGRHHRRRRAVPREPPGQCERGGAARERVRADPRGVRRRRRHPVLSPGPARPQPGGGPPTLETGR